MEVPTHTSEWTGQDRALESHTVQAENDFNTNLAQNGIFYFSEI